MIFRRPKDKEGDLVTQESKEGLKTITFFIKAEGPVTSAFYLGGFSGNDDGTITGSVSPLPHR
jgi:hypothetical protein